MIITKCPLRVSLVGGSTDTPQFIQTYKRGAVINFPINLYTYIMLNDNRNPISNKYRISYSNVEEIDNIDSIQNDIAREVIRHFNLPPVEIAFNSDISNTGNGLATSSSYMIALIKAVDIYLNLKMTQYEICELAFVLEKRFNPYVGYQDVFGCGLGGLKRIDFVQSQKIQSGCVPSFVYLNTKLLNSFKLVLIPTGIQRQSATILKTLDHAECAKLLKYVDIMENAIKSECTSAFHKTILNNWEQKKNTSRLISDNQKIQVMEKFFANTTPIRSWKLLGAGGGGYFLIVIEQDIDIKNEIHIEIDIDGVRVV